MKVSRLDILGGFKLEGYVGTLSLNCNFGLSGS
jgi:hypothetical protein